MNSTENENGNCPPLADDELQGFHPLKKSRRNATYFKEHALQEGWLMPSRDASHYRAKEPLTGEDVTLQKVEMLIGKPVYLEFNERAFDRRPRVGILAPPEDGIFTLFEDIDGHCGAAAFSLKSVASIGRAWLLLQ